MQKILPVQGPGKSETVHLAAWFGRALEEDKQIEDAIKAYETATAFAPKDADIWFTLGLAYSTAGDQKRAAEVYKNLRKLDPTKAEELSKERPALLAQAK